MAYPADPFFDGMVAALAIGAAWAMVRAWYQERRQRRLEHERRAAARERRRREFERANAYHAAVHRL